MDIPAFLRAGNTGNTAEIKPAVEPLVRLWLLRILVCLGAHRGLVQRDGFVRDELAELVGLGHWVAQPGKFDMGAVLLDLRQQHLQAEQQSRDALVPDDLRHNIAQLKALIGLSETDCRLLEFVVCLHHDRLLDDTADWLGQLSSIQLFHVVAVILGLPLAQVRDALSAQGLLARCALVMMDRKGSYALRSKLDLLSNTFADMMMSAEADPVSLLRGTVSLAEKSHLALADYHHIHASLAILRPYLRRAMESGRRGVNIFLHGAPGTGKSQLTRLLAEDLGCALFEVASENLDGDPIKGENRLRAFRAAQSFFVRSKTLILFDEVEDVFCDGDAIGRKSTAQLRKGWINHLLEENPVPTLWLSNAIEGLDPAFIRRFDMVLELPVPPARQRAQILQDYCGDFLDSQRIARLADIAPLAPAVVSRASAVVRSIAADIGQAQVATAFERLVDNTLQAQGHAPLRREDAERLPEVYDPAFVHVDADLNALANGLAHARCARLCLYGPPGTGKTAYGRWLARHLDMPLLVRRASDLLSKWVGQSEKNIAAAFSEAESEGALLLIDEVDSFLQDRRGAQRSWELSQVNELLTQMESFSGIFVASTNLMDGLDPAALRRFDLKLRFDFLRPPQAWELLRRHCATLGLTSPGASLRPRLDQLRQLAPGDFAAVARQHRFRPLSSASALVSALEVECELKQGARRVVGFA